MGFQSGFRVNTNTAALNTYRSYSSAQAGLERNIERLSSGLRINRAADDSAGLSISQRMNNQIRGLQQSNRNVQQGNNMLQTAEGGLGQIHSILARMRELAVQSSSDGVNADDRASIDLEFQQLKAEISRIGDATEYNGMKLINGQRAKNLVGESNSVGGNMSSDSVIADTKVASFADNGTYLLTKDSDSSYTLSLFNDSQADLGVSLNASSDALALSTGDGTKFSVGDVIQIEDELMLVTAKATDNLTVTRGYAGTTAAAHDGSGTAIDINKADSSKSQTVTRTGTQGSGFSDVDGDQINFDRLGIVAKTLSSGSASSFTVDDGNYMTIQVGADNDSARPASDASVGANVTENRITFNLADATSEGLAIDSIDLDSLGDAQSAINSLDAAIQKINDERSNIGALQNRFEYTSSNLMNSIQNNSASLSTIQDADFAIEAADLARNQILTQSSSAMLAQANQISQNVLGLLR
jgi:flagellin